MSRDLISCIDLTLLDEQAPFSELMSVYEKAVALNTACVCLYLKDIEQLGNKARNFNIATVVNFPHGINSLESSLAEIKKAQELGVKEIDFVFPYSWYLNGETDKALGVTKAISQACVKANLKLKIIMETGAFASMDQVYQLSLELIELGCDFLKTSTGKIAQGASLPAAQAILTAIRDSNSDCGIKLSGGVREKEQAVAYVEQAESALGKKINPSWFRIGASSLLRSLE